jgi:hypothetical protein
MDKAELDKLRNGDIYALADALPAEVHWGYPIYPEHMKDILAPFLDHIDALEQKASAAIACWDRVYPDADAKKIGITQDELEDMEFGPINSLRKMIAAAPGPKS